MHFFSLPVSCLLHHDPGDFTSGETWTEYAIGVRIGGGSAGGVRDHIPPRGGGASPHTCGLVEWTNPRCRYRKDLTLPHHIFSAHDAQKHPSYPLHAFLMWTSKVEIPSPYSPSSTSASSCPDSSSEEAAGHTNMWCPPVGHLIPSHDQDTACARQGHLHQNW